MGERLVDMLAVLDDDILAVKDKLEKKPSSQFWRRNFIRVFFSVVEGYIFTMKRFALDAHDRGDVQFSLEELALLHELEFYLDKGKPKGRQKFLKLEDNFRFAFLMLAKAVGSPFKLDVGNNRWESFKNTMQIRNRITHPKTCADLEVTNKEMTRVKEAWNWYRKVQREFALSTSGGVSE